MDSIIESIIEFEIIIFYFLRKSNSDGKMLRQYRAFYIFNKYFLIKDIYQD